MKTIFARIAFVVFGFLALAAHARADGHEALLSRFKAATGGTTWDAVTSLRSQGTLEAAGLSGQVTVLEDVRGGRMSSRYTLGPVSGASGNDGSTGWQQDPGGEVSRSDGPEARARSRSEAWLASRAFWYAQRGAAEYATPGTGVDEGRRCRTLGVTPQDGEPVTLWFDDESGLLVRSDMRVGNELQVTRYADWRDVDGLRLPFRIVTDLSDPRQRVTLAFTAIERGVALADADFAIPQMERNSARIDDPSGIARIPFELLNNHIYANGTIDGQPARLLVDTGGVNLLTPASARRLGLEGKGRLAGRGVGEERVDVAIAHGTEIRIGALRMQRPTFYLMDLGVLDAVEGEAFDGLVGYEIFRRFGVTIDYAQRVLTIAEPATFVPPPDATALAFTMNERIPVIEGSLDGVPMRISVDTGSRASLSFHAPFAREQRLAERHRTTPTTVLGWGVGGPMRGRALRLGTLKLGTIAIEGLAADLFEGDKGAFASPDVSANLGGGLLRRFTVAFDYENRRMHLVPNTQFAQPHAFDRSGLWLLGDGDALKIGGVMPSSPAALAGLREGDRIGAIGGEAIATRTLAQWREQLRERAVGTRLEIGYVRAGKAATATIVLADLIPAQAR